MQHTEVADDWTSDRMQRQFIAGAELARLERDEHYSWQFWWGVVVSVQHTAPQKRCGGRQRERRAMRRGARSTRGSPDDSEPACSGSRGGWSL